MKLQYRLALMREITRSGKEKYLLCTANNENDVIRIGNLFGFVHWVHDEWQDVLCEIPDGDGKW